MKDAILRFNARNSKQNVLGFVALQRYNFPHLGTFAPICPWRTCQYAYTGNLRCKSASNLKNHLILYFSRCLGKFSFVMQVDRINRLRDNFKLICALTRLALAQNTCVNCPLGQRYLSKCVTKLGCKLGRNYVEWKSSKNTIWFCFWIRVRNTVLYRRNPVGYSTPKIADYKAQNERTCKPFVLCWMFIALRWATAVVV